MSLILINVSFISAGIYYSNLKSTYNLGDTIDVNVGVDPVLEGFLVRVDLVCEGSSVINFNIFPESDGIANVKLPLNFFTIQDAGGDCYFLSDYDSYNKESMHFKISKRLDLYLDTDSFFANPGDMIIITGTAKRLNGENINGEVEIDIPLLSLISGAVEEVVEVEEIVEEEIIEEDEIIVDEDGEIVEEEIVDEIVDEVIAEIVDSSNNAGKFYGKVVNGIFSVNFSLGEDTPAGDYRIDILIYEEISGVKTSEDGLISSLKILQVPTSIDVAIETQNIDPDNNFNFLPRLLDQAGVLIPEEITSIIKNENGERVFEKIVNSNENVIFPVPSDLRAGYYEIEVSSGEIVDLKKFYVNEKAIAEFVIENETLIVTNVGNIPYTKDIEIELNGKPFVKSVDLKLGASDKFILTGSDEEYNIKISDGDNEIIKSGVVLTGNVVGVKEVGAGISLAVTTPIFWIFFVLVLIIGVLYLFRKVFKKKSFAYPFSKKKGKTINLDDKGKIVNEDKQKRDDPVKEIGNVSSGDGGNKVPGVLVPPSQAEQVLVLKGHKNKAALVVIKIKNRIGELAKKSLEKAVEHVYSKRGAVYEKGDYIFIIFSPIMTRTSNNEVEAAKCAERISLFLKEHNKKIKDPVQFGIGISSGDIINKVEDKKLKFTALGNFVNIGKRLADASDEQILVSKEAYQNGISEIKADKKQINGGDVYEIKKVIDHEKNKEFIRKFLERQKRER